MLGETIRNYRKAQNLSQREAAKMIGTSQSYLSLLESGKLSPGYAMVKKIAKFLHVTQQEVIQLL